MMFVTKSERPVSLVNPDESLELVIKVGRTCGLAPFTYTKKANGATVAYSRSYELYSVLLALAVGAATVIGTMDDLFEDHKRRIRIFGTTTVYVTLVDFAGLVIAFLVNAYYAVSRNDCFLSILSDFNKIDTLLLKTTKSRKTHYVRLMSITITSSAILFVVDCLVEYFNTWKRAGKYGVLKFVPLYLLQELVIVLLLQYWIIVDSIKRRISLLKFELELMGKQLHHSKYFKCTKRKQTGAEFVKELKRILTTYQCIVKTVHSTNTLYGMPILVFLFNVLLHEVVIMYYWLEEILYYQRPNVLVSSLLWIVGYGYILVLTVNGPHAIATECLHISSSVAELLAFDLEMAMRAQLKTFSSALVHQPIRFSAKGLLDVDRKIITSMTAVITTYIVVLMQYSAANNVEDDD